MSLTDAGFVVGILLLAAAAGWFLVPEIATVMGAWCYTPPPDEPRRVPPPSPGAQVPMFITAAMRVRLYALGLTEAQVDALTPESAWKLLREMDPREGDP